MNHRRKRTVRRELKRNSRKKLRGATRAAMDGQNPDTVALEWRCGKMNAEVPVVNDVPSHRKVTRKKRKPKQKCAAGGSHTWERSEEVTKDFYRNEITDCARCVKLFKDWNRTAEWYNQIFPNSPTYKGENPYAWSVRWNRCRDHGTKVYYNITTTYRTCSKCSHKQRLDVDNERWNYRRRDLVLPRRKVTLD